MSRRKLITTSIVCAIISAGCCFLNIFFPIFALAILYFAMRNMLKTILTTNGASAYLKYKWLWIGLFAAPYPLVILSGIIAFPADEEPFNWKNFTTVLALFSTYTGLALLFGEQISRALLKKTNREQLA